MNRETTCMNIFDAVTIAAEAHQNDHRADGPYIAHPVRVMLRVDGEHARMTAMLHDVVEGALVSPLRLSLRATAERCAAPSCSAPGTEPLARTHKLPSVCAHVCTCNTAAKH